MIWNNSGVLDIIYQPMSPCTAHSYIPKNTAPPADIHNVRGTTPANSAFGPSVTYICFSLVEREGRAWCVGSYIHTTEQSQEEDDDDGGEGGKEETYAKIEHHSSFEDVQRSGECGGDTTCYAPACSCFVRVQRFPTSRE